MSWPPATWIVPGATGAESRSGKELTSRGSPSRRRPIRLLFEPTRKGGRLERASRSVERADIRAAQDPDRVLAGRYPGIGGRVRVGIDPDRAGTTSPLKRSSLEQLPSQWCLPAAAHRHNFAHRHVRGQGPAVPLRESKNSTEAAGTARRLGPRPWRPWEPRPAPVPGTKNAVGATDQCQLEHCKGELPTSALASSADRLSNAPPIGTPH